MRLAATLALAAALALAGFRVQAQGSQPGPGARPFSVFLSVNGEDGASASDAYASISTALSASPLVLAVYGPAGAAKAAGAPVRRLFVDVVVRKGEEGDVASWSISGTPRGAALAEGEVDRTSSSPAWGDTISWRPLVDGLAIATEKSLAGPTIGVGPEQMAAPRWAIDTSLYGLDFPEIRLSFNPSPSWYLRATLTQFAFGLSFRNAASAAYPSLLYSTSLAQPGLGIGWLPFKGNWGLKPYFGLDSFLRLAFPAGYGVFIDPLAPVGLMPIAGLEWSRSRAVAAFFEAGAIVYPFADRASMMASAGADASGRLLFGGDGLFPGHPGWFGEFPVARFGLRFGL
jgi:hypothetical protein